MSGMTCGVGRWPRVLGFCFSVIIAPISVNVSVSISSQGGLSAAIKGGLLGVVGQRGEVKAMTPRVGASSLLVSSCSLDMLMRFLLLCRFTDFGIVRE